MQAWIYRVFLFLPDTVFPHSVLMHIRDILGHTSVKTTEIYARVCNAKKRAALEKAYEEVTEQNEDDWSKNEDLMSWLVGLSKRK